MTRFVACLVAVGIASLIAAEGAAACSCVAPERDETLRGVDAAATARLVDVEPREDRSFGAATFTYRLTRVYKGSRRYNLREGGRLVIENNTNGASCGLPTETGRRYGLRLFGNNRQRLNTSSCDIRSPRELRRSAKRSGNARTTATNARASAIRRCDGSAS